MEYSYNDFIISLLLILCVPSLGLLFLLSRTPLHHIMGHISSFFPCLVIFIMYQLLILTLFDRVFFFCFCFFAPFSIIFEPYSGTQLNYLEII